MSPKNPHPSYATPPPWSHIPPIPLQDTSSPLSSAPALATIAYSPRYAEAMSYLRALMARNEHSDRALALTADIIAMNPAHYTVRLYRAAALRSLSSSSSSSASPGDDASYLDRVRQELSWLSDSGVCARNLKNYQVWHHRQTMVAQLPCLPGGEMEFVTEILALDAKNYHVWGYRQWLCVRFPEEVLESGTELVAVERLIDEDVRNNSAWSYRYFICFGAEELKAKAAEGKGKGWEVVDEELVEREVDFATGKIGLAPQNASPWNYLKGVLKRGGRGLDTMLEFCEGFVGEDLLGEGVRSSHAVDWLAEIYQKRGEQRKAVECWDALTKKWDPIRANYWEYRKQQIVSVS